MTAMSSPHRHGAQPPGWFPDPSGQPYLRWWDGTWWGDQVIPPQGGPPAFSPAPKKPAGLSVLFTIVGIYIVLVVLAVVALVAFIGLASID